MGRGWKASFPGPASLHLDMDMKQLHPTLEGSVSSTASLALHLPLLVSKVLGFLQTSLPACSQLSRHQPRCCYQEQRKIKAANNPLGL